MAEGVVLMYGFLVTFVLSSAKSNSKAKRPHPTILVGVAWGMMSLSFVISAMLGIRALTMITA